MVDESVLQQLRQDVLDEVSETGRVGVYELVWSLRTQEPKLTDAERVELAKKAAAELLETGDLVLYRFEWPDNAPLGPLTLDTVSDDDWLAVPESESYPAFVNALDG